METHKRTIAKTISWRLLATVITMSIAWGISGDPAIALSVGLADTTLKLFFFYGHERVWAGVSYGYASKERPVRSANKNSAVHVPVQRSEYPRVHQSRRFKEIRKGSLSGFAWQRQDPTRPGDHDVFPGANAAN